MPENPQHHKQDRTPADAPSPHDPGDEAVGGGAATSHDGLADDASIVDTILDLDDFLSGDVRRATRRVPFATRPDLEGQIDDLELELSRLVDAQGRPLSVDDGALAGPTRGLAAVQADYAELRAAYDASMRVVEFEALDDEAFDDFKRRYPALMADDAKPDDRRRAFDALIVACAKKPTFTAEQLGKFRKLVGSTVMIVLGNTAFAVNTASGVSVPKSQLFSRVQRHAERVRS